MYIKYGKYKIEVKFVRGSNNRVTHTERETQTYIYIHTNPSSEKLCSNNWQIILKSFMWRLMRQFMISNIEFNKNDWTNVQNYSTLTLYNRKFEMNEILFIFFCRE